MKQTGKRSGIARSRDITHSRRERTVPRRFEMPWGKGQIVEEASAVGQYHEPAIQLLHYDDGTWSIRFAHYDHGGRFQRSPLMLGPHELKALQKTLHQTPRLRKLLAQMLK